MRTALAQEQPSAEDEIKDGKRGASSSVLHDPELEPKLPTPVVDAATFLNRLVSDAVRHSGCPWRVRACKHRIGASSQGVLSVVRACRVLRLCKGNHERTLSPNAGE